MADFRTEIVIYNHDDEMGAILADAVRELNRNVEVESICNVDRFKKRCSEGRIALLVAEAHRFSEISAWTQSLTCRVLLLANRMPEEEWASAQKMGATEYLMLPFDRAVFMSRVRKLLEHQSPLKLCEKSFDVFVAGERIHLTPHEFKLLKALSARSGDVLSRDELIAAVQGEGIVVVDRAIDTHIFSLRKKLGALGDSIETVRSSGYRFKVNEANI